jgi:hypothetical protein
MIRLRRTTGAGDRDGLCAQQLPGHRALAQSAVRRIIELTGLDLENFREFNADPGSEAGCRST